MPNGDDATNSWNTTQGGFRSDWYAEGNNTVTFQGDGYSGNVDQSTPRPLTVDGQNLLGRWTHQFTEESELTVQTYFDRTWRKIPGQYQEDLKTYDFDLQHRFAWTERQTITWGGGYRLMQDKVGNSTNLAFIPAEKNLQLFSAFLQDEIQLMPDRLKLTLGTKVEHNDYSGFEFEPSGRIAWTIDPQNTVWSAVSRAVRSPSRIDTEFRVPGDPPYVLAGSDDFKSEEVVACELGYRVQPHKRTAFSVATFYNFYDNIRSLEPVTTSTYSIQNKNQAESWGVELSGMCQISEWWRLRGGYTFLETHVTRKEGGLDLNRGRAEGNDPQNQFVIQSMADLPYRFQFDLVGRYVGTLNSPHVPSYLTFDARLAWWATTNLEISVTGQNLWDNQHPEFGAAATRQEIPRSVYGKVTWRF
jgi:iron complex outermembrane receptor protein